MISPCPIEACPGAVHVLHLAGFTAFGCDGPASHPDSAIRNALILESGDRLMSWEGLAEGALRRIDPVAWVQDQVLSARVIPEEKFEKRDLHHLEALPTYATGFVGRERGALLELKGMTTLSGRASSGKSWFAVGSACSSALDGWDVHYLVAEGADVIGRRIYEAFDGQPPPNLRLHGVRPGVTVDDMIEEIATWIISTRTLIVIDSISTLMGLMVVNPNANRWDEQGKLEIFLMRLRELTHGELGIINIAEANALGETKGRTLDHKSDISINFKSCEDSEAKEIRVVKSWEGRTGLVGRAQVNARGPGLELIYDGPVSDADDGEVF